MPRRRGTAIGAILLVAGLPSLSGLAQPLQPGRGAITFSFAWVEPARLGTGVVERLLTTFDAGQYTDFDRLAGTLSSSLINPFEFETGAQRWIDEGTDRRRRALVAATVALELARGQVSAGWQTSVHLGFVLAELGCAWLRDDAPSATEQAWHTAFFALARDTGGNERYVKPIAPLHRLAELAHSPGAAEWRQQNERRRLQQDGEFQKAHATLMTRLQRSATGVSGSTKIDGVTPATRIDLLRAPEHAAHVNARFPDDPSSLFLEATVRERDRMSWPDTLLDGRSAPVWVEAAEIDRIARDGPRRVENMARSLRMDRTLADKLLLINPEPLQRVNGSSAFGEQPSAAFISLALWEIVDAFQAVPVRAPVAAETSLRLGRTYARLARPDLALPVLTRAESLATTPYEQYLARLFAGALFARTGRRAEAIMAFRGALEAAPRAQTASFALAPLLLEEDDEEAAAEILETATSLPLANDPLINYYDGDLTAVTRAFARLREAARR